MSVTIGLPQFIYIALTIIGLIHAIQNNGKYHQINVRKSIATTLIIYGILILGGFFG